MVARKARTAKPIAATETINALALDAPAVHVAIATNSGVRVHETETGELVCNVQVPDAEIVDCRLSGDGAFVVAVARSGEAHHVHSFRVSDGTQVHEECPHIADVGELEGVDAHFVGYAISADGSRFAPMFDCYQMFEVVDLRKRGRRVVKCELFASVMRERIAVAISPRADRVAVAIPGCVRVFDVSKSNTTSMIHPKMTIGDKPSDMGDGIPASAPADPIELLGFTPDGKRLVYLGERSELWQAKRRVPTVVSIVDLSARKAREIPYSRPAKYVPIALIGGTHVLWASSGAKGGPLQRQALATGAFVRTRLSTTGPVAVSADGKSIAHAKRRSVVVEPLPAK